MRPQKLVIIPAAADRNGVASSATPGSATAVTINGALATGGIATLTPPSHVSVFSTVTDSGTVITLTGTNRYGATITEAITGPAASSATVKGTKNFATVSSASLSSTASGNIELGSADELETAWKPVDYNTSAMRVHVKEGSTADMDYVIQYSVEDPWAVGFSEDAADPQDGDPAPPVRAVRTKVTNFVAGQIETIILSAQE